MLIALDYDGTYTTDKKFWDDFIDYAELRGFEVICITMKTPQEAIDIPCEVIYTSRQAKLKYVQEIGLKIDIWIDDMPELIFQGAE